MSSGRGNGRSRPRRKDRVDPARRIAFEVLDAVDQEDAYSNLRLAQALREHDLNDRDAALATELTFGTLRLRGRYDAVISACVNRDLDSLDPPVLTVLRLGSHQLLSMRIPDYAAVGSSVALVKEIVGHRVGGFVNAVLRKVAVRDWPQWQDELVSHAEPLLRRLSITQSHPEWIIEALSRALSACDRQDELEALLGVNNTAPPVTLVARPGRITQQQLLEQSGGEPGRWSPWAVRLAGDPGRVAAVRSGAAGVQDEGSQVVVQGAWQAGVAEERQWLDLCAGPGGKAALLAGLAEPVGAHLTAVELHRHRLELVARSLPEPQRVTLVQGDATQLRLPAADRVLLDTPCLGLGVLRRRPELRWRRSPGQLQDLQGMQRRLLSTALEHLRPGGLVAYVTCSPHLGETDEIVDHALARHADIRLEPVRDPVPGLGAATARGTLRLWPHIHDTDGMYLALLRRRATP